MSGWGLEGWGLTPWGGTPPLPPTVAILAVIGPLGYDAAGAIADVLGGDVIQILGSEFEDPMTIEVLSGPSGGPYVVEGTCFTFDPRYDLVSDSVHTGVPPLPYGTYHLRATTGAGTFVLEDALRFRPFAEELKVNRVRVGFAHQWATGQRVLLGG